MLLGKSICSLETGASQGLNNETTTDFKAPISSNQMKEGNNMFFVKIKNYVKLTFFVIVMSGYVKGVEACKNILSKDKAAEFVKAYKIKNNISVTEFTHIAITRQESGCHYLYKEFNLKKRHSENFFTLYEDGEIVNHTTKAWKKKCKNMGLKPTYFRKQIETLEKARLSNFVPSASSLRVYGCKYKYYVEFETKTENITLVYHFDFKGRFIYKNEARLY